MGTSLDILLTSVPLSEWKVRQVIVFDWSDGPIEGVCELATPFSCFHFRLFAQREMQDDTDSRLFKLSELPLGMMNRILNLLKVLGHPNKIVWTPRWSFKTIEQQKIVEKDLENLLEQGVLTRIILSSKDMVHFQDYWITTSS